jgi:hypothetical protein
MRTSKIVGYWKKVAFSDAMLHVLGADDQLHNSRLLAERSSDKRRVDVMVERARKYIREFGGEDPSPITRALFVEDAP